MGPLWAPRAPHGSPKWSQKSYFWPPWVANGAFGVHYGGLWEHFAQFRCFREHFWTNLEVIWGQRVVRRGVAQMSKESLVILFSFAGFSLIPCLSLACFACFPLAGKCCQDFSRIFSNTVFFCWFFPYFLLVSCLFCCSI